MTRQFTDQEITDTMERLRLDMLVSLNNGSTVEELIECYGSEDPAINAMLLEAIEQHNESHGA